MKSAGSAEPPGGPTANPSRVSSGSPPQMLSESVETQFIFFYIFDQLLTRLIEIDVMS